MRILFLLSPFYALSQGDQMGEGALGVERKIIHVPYRSARPLGPLHWRFHIYSD